MAESMRFRNPEVAHSIAEKIRDVAPKKGQVKICHVCGTHEWTITHFGLSAVCCQRMLKLLRVPAVPSVLFQPPKSTKPCSWLNRAKS